MSFKLVELPEIGEFRLTRSSLEIVIRVNTNLIRVWSTIWSVRKNNNFEQLAVIPFFIFKFERIGQKNLTENSNQMLMKTWLIKTSYKIFACVFDESSVKSNVYRTISLMSNIIIYVQQ